MEKPLKVRLHILSPIHIGCDDVYEPTNFVIDEEKGKLIEFEPLEFIKSLTPADRQSFSNICSSGNIASIVQILKFLSDRQIKGREVEIAKGLTEHCKKVRNLPLNNETTLKQELNKFTIGRTVYNPNNSQPYIPGSSLKGALRTAYLSMQAKDKGIRGRKDNSKGLEKELLDGGSFETDPFRMVRISDLLPVGEPKTRIVYAVNRKKKTSKFEARGPFQILEVIKDGIFEGVINIERPDKNAGIIKPVNVESLINSLKAFYEKVLDDDNKACKDIGVETQNFASLQEKFIIRLGRHSGAEAVTIEGNRDIKIMQGKDQDGRNKPPKYLDHATTIWLASETSKPANNNGLTPFGWAMMELLPFDVKNPYPASIVKEKPENKETAKEERKVAPPRPVPVITPWENAFLNWNTGSKILIATLNNKKAEIKLGDDRSMVPEALHKKLFEGKAVKAKVTVEPLGNSFKILKIELPGQL